MELLDGDLVATKADVLPARRAVAMAVNFMVILVVMILWLRRASLASSAKIKDELDIFGYG